MATTPPCGHPSTEGNFQAVLIPLCGGVARHATGWSMRGMLREHAPRSDAAKPDPPSATGVVLYHSCRGMLRNHKRLVVHWLTRIACNHPGLFAHWQNGIPKTRKRRMSGDVHVRFRERLEGKFLWATRLTARK